jgi:cytochrome c-type biogenesis protein CcmI
MLIASISVVAGTVCLLYALVHSTRRRRKPSKAPRVGHLAGHTHRLAALVRQLDAGTLSPEGFDEARRELERDLLESAQATAMRTSP